VSITLQFLLLILQCSVVSYNRVWSC